MHPDALFEWEGRQYASEEKSGDWYWAVGIIALAGAVASILFGNILLALVISAAAVTLSLQAAKRPRIHRFTITNAGLYIDDTFYPFECMLHFSVLEYLDPSLPPALSIKTKRFFAPHLLIPIVGHDPVAVYGYLMNHIEEGRHEESFFDRLADLLRL